MVAFVLLLLPYHLLLGQFVCDKTVDIDGALVLGPRQQPGEAVAERNYRLDAVTLPQLLPDFFIQNVDIGHLFVPLEGQVDALNDLKYVLLIHFWRGNCARRLLRLLFDRAEMSWHDLLHGRLQLIFKTFKLLTLLERGVLLRILLPEEGTAAD